jgi:hypothetical protein
VKLVATVGTREETETVRAAGLGTPARATLLAERSTRRTCSSPAGDVHARRHAARAAARLARPTVAARAGDGRRRTTGQLRPMRSIRRRPDVSAALHRHRLAGDSGRHAARTHADKERSCSTTSSSLRPLPVLQGPGPLRILDAGAAKAT